MAKTKGKGGDRSAFSFDTARENPFAAAAAVGGAVAAGVFLWSRRNQISDQISQLSEQIGEWREGMRSGSAESEFEFAGADEQFTTSTSKPRVARGMSAGKRRRPEMNETGGGNADLGRRSGGSGMKTSASSRGRARGIPSTT